MASSSANPRDIFASDSPIWFLQWNCRGIRRKQADLQRRLSITPTLPLAVLLVEAGTNSPNLIGYKPHCTHSIPHRCPGTGSRTAHPVGNGQACVLVLSRAAHAELDTSAWGTQALEVAGVHLTSDRDQRALVFSVYARSFGTTTYRVDMSFLEHFLRIYPQDRVIVGGDFNAMHAWWGYQRSDGRGRHLWQQIVKAKLTIVNELALPTRFGQHRGQQDTSPDLTLVSHHREFQLSWVDDVMGRDYYSVVLSWVPRGRKLLQPPQYHRIEEHGSWDDFRTTLSEVDVPTGLDELIVQINDAKKKATTKLSVKFDAPKPDSHLFRLWNRRLRALKAYRRSGRTTRRRRALKRISQEVQQYTMNLARQDWQMLCHCSMKPPTCPGHGIFFELCLDARGLFSIPKAWP
ncbi:hypothetical protein HPB48_011350 [Haemaphysalis longicornis]|uniref:Endonuclease/exonuclease/phosphatase domain-containing protein n=1 Tax=Haemaphysalis longicornis TaxID=44386 RepID=A0A9J6GH83_HAELO|nr:hypothetical protein HPB48_011350 [Haemaphysalis longicornis]